jgi:hypothetical protein
MDFFVGFHYGFVTFVKESFLEACESLLVACELDNDVETQVVVDKATIACRMFNNGLFPPCA